MTSVSFFSTFLVFESAGRLADDPSGPILVDGTWHVFPDGSTAPGKGWSHFTSKDLLRWQRQANSTVAGGKALPLPCVFHCLHGQDTASTTASTLCVPLLSCLRHCPLPCVFHCLRG